MGGILTEVCISMAGWWWWEWGWDTWYLQRFVSAWLAGGGGILGTYRGLYQHGWLVVVGMGYLQRFVSAWLAGGGGGGGGILGTYRGLYQHGWLVVVGMGYLQRFVSAWLAGGGGDGVLTEVCISMARWWVVGVGYLQRFVSAWLAGRASVALCPAGKRVGWPPLNTWPSPW